MTTAPPVIAVDGPTASGNGTVLESCSQSSSIMSPLWHGIGVMMAEPPDESVRPVEWVDGVSDDARIARKLGSSDAIFLAGTTRVTAQCGRFFP